MASTSSFTDLGATARAPVDTGVMLWSPVVGPYVWHEYDSARMRGELRAIAATGLATVRILLPWDVFMPTPTAVPSMRMRQLDEVLALAEEHGVRVIPVLFAQSLGGCIMLPPYAIDVAGRRAGVRVVTDAVVQPGGPRDQHTEPLLIEAQHVWLDTLLSAFAGHPSISVWDLGHDPASTMRPRRIDEQRRWCATLADAVHARGERCMLTLGQADILAARGVRPGVLAPALDALGLAVDAGAAGFGGDAADAGRLAFLAQLFLRVSGAATPLVVHVAAPPREDAGGDGQAALARNIVDALVEVGSAGVHAAHWAETGERTVGIPPFDRRRDLTRRGLVDTHGGRTPFGAAWIDSITSDAERCAAQPWPERIDVEDFYANLPESLLDLHAAWDAGGGDRPAMLD